MRRNAYNVVLFMFLAGGLFFVWQQAEKNLPKPAVKKDDKQEVAEGDKKDDSKKDAPQDAPKDKEPPKDQPKVAPAPAPEPPTLLAMGDANSYLRLMLTTRGGGVQQVILTKFDQADRLGREVYQKDASGNPTKTGVPLHLIPGVVQTRGKFLREEYAVPDLKPGKVADAAHLAEPSFTVFHYHTADAGDKYPDPLLGERNWTVVSEERPEGGEHKVVLETELGEPYYLKLRKIYTLAPKDYHIGLRLEVEKLSTPGAAKGRGKTRLQMSGPRGLPIESEWATTTYRNSVIGWVDDKGTPQRKLEEAATIGNKRGGDEQTRTGHLFKYMVVATQFFASGVAVDDRADDTFEKGRKNPWAYARATTEIPFDKKQDPNLPYFDDITVRAASEELDLAPGEKVSHSYLLYNGPSKVRLLGLMKGERAVDGALVDRYKDALTLKTITDFRSDTWLGWFANKIWWTDLVIALTNLMHWLLAVIHSALGSWAGSWALSIVVLTIGVRLMLFYPSRKQTAMSMKMMEVQKKLQPEFEKLYEKYKDDMQRYNTEKTRLMMANGANPFAAMGGCLLLFAQMPIMMGLYFCLQESVFFRLDSFLWADNLAAPDMLIWWSEKIPYVSTPEDIGSFIYLGPFFNLLPVLAVGLMLYQQAKMMPPSTDPQAEQQRMMMKMMMVMMAVFFYKVAAGLSLYFIVSTLWGIIERQLIPKPEVKIDSEVKGLDSNGKAAKPVSTANLSPEAKAAIEKARAEKPKGFFGKLRRAFQEKMEEMQRKADEQSKRQIRNDPNRPDGDSGGPGGGGNGPPRRDKDKKKRRKK